MKLRMIDPAWAGFTGQMGEYEFVDGLSVDDIPDRAAQRLSAQFQMEYEDGSSSNPAQELINMRQMSVDDGVQLQNQNDTSISKAMAPKVWTRAELEDIADMKGIAGIREIADPMGLRSNAVAKLIAAILQAQSGVSTEPSETDKQFLLGSSVQPSTFEIDGKTVQLGTVVADAHAASGLTFEEWNDLPGELREEHIAKAVERLKAV